MGYFVNLLFIKIYSQVYAEVYKEKGVKFFRSARRVGSFFSVNPVYIRFEFSWAFPDLL